MLRDVLGAITLVLACISYVPYVRDVLQGKTKPHAFTWLVWGILMAVGFGVAVTNGGGAGTWQIGFSAVVVTGIFVLSLWLGEKDIRPSDWACLIGAFAAGVLWLVANNDLMSAILITVIDVLGFIPTFRKSYLKPHQETLSTQLIGITKHGLSILALSTLSVVTVLYPFSLFTMNIVFAAFLVVRRRQLNLRPVAASVALDSNPL